MRGRTLPIACGLYTTVLETVQLIDQSILGITQINTLVKILLVKYVQKKIQQYILLKNYFKD